MTKYEKISADPAVQEHYEKCRKSGCTHKLAEMLATKTPPRVKNTYSPMHPRRNRGRGY